MQCKRQCWQANRPLKTPCGFEFLWLKFWYGNISEYFLCISEIEESNNRMCGNRSGYVSTWAHEYKLPRAIRLNILMISSNVPCHESYMHAWQRNWRYFLLPIVNSLFFSPIEQTFDFECSIYLAYIICLTVFDTFFLKCFDKNRTDWTFFFLNVVSMSIRFRNKKYFSFN